MGTLSPGAQIAWRIAAAEAAATGHASIDTAHVLAAVLSLDKVDAAALRSLGGAPGDLPFVQAEAARVAAALGGLGGGPVALRRLVRGAVARGSEAPQPGAAMKRTPGARTAFERAARLAGEAAADTLHLLRALAEAPPVPVVEALARLGLSLAAVADRARVASHLAAADTRLHAAHGVHLRAEGDAVRWMAEQGAAGDEALTALLAKVVDGPLEKLAASGLLQRHATWRAVYDEGGIYLLPDEDTGKPRVQA